MASRVQLCISVRSAGAVKAVVYSAVGIEPDELACERTADEQLAVRLQLELSDTRAAAERKRKSIGSLNALVGIEPREARLSKRR